MTRIGRWLALIGLLAWAGHAGAQTRGVTDGEILLGATFGLTGNVASSGQGHSLGIKVAIGEANAGGGIAGRKLRLILEDDAYVPARTVQNIRKLLDVDKVFAILGTSSSAGALATIDAITQSGAINMNAYIQNTEMWSTFRPTTFSVGQGYPRQVEVVVRYMNGAFPKLKWGLIVQDDAFGQNIVAGMKQAFDGDIAGVEIVKFKRGQQDFSADMLRLKAAGVTAIYAGGVFSEYLAFAREAKRIDMPVKFGFLFSSHSTLLQNLMGELGQGYFTSDTVSTLTEPNGRAFLELAKTYLTPKEMEAVTRDSFAGYAGARTLVEALKRCGRDVTKDCAVRELEATRDEKTLVMGPISFGQGIRFSDQKMRVLMNDFAKREFVPVTDYQ